MPIKLAGIAKREQKRAPMQALQTAVVSQISGILGDSRGKPSNRQITVLSEDSWLDATQSLRRELDWLIRRANLMIKGKVFSASDIGSTLSIGQVVLEITNECVPCYRMDEQIAGLQAVLTPPFVGGVCCKVLHGGVINIGQPVVIQSAQKQQNLF